jgi:predicted secreted Zn-dependent protease
MTPPPPQPKVTRTPPPPTVTPAPPQPTVTLTTTKATTYYSVRGTTTSKIFEEIEAHRLVEQDGTHAAGLAAANSEVKWNARENGVLCTPGPVRITLDLVVTLPRHEHPNDLAEELRQRWQHFAAAVAAHEQRHVDIFLDGATAVRARIEAALKDWMSCIDLNATIERLWKDQQIETEKAQREFDLDDRARIADDRKPLQVAIDTRNARLTTVTAELRQLDATLDERGRRVDAVRAKIDAVKVDLAKANATCSRPTNRIAPLCRQYNALAADHNALVREHASVAMHRNRVATEHNMLLESITGLLEALNWAY